MRRGLAEAGVVIGVGASVFGVLEGVSFADRHMAESRNAKVRRCAENLGSQSVITTVLPEGCEAQAFRRVVSTKLSIDTSGNTQTLSSQTVYNLPPAGEFIEANLDSRSSDGTGGDMIRNGGAGALFALTAAAALVTRRLKRQEQDIEIQQLDVRAQRQEFDLEGGADG